MNIRKWLIGTLVKETKGYFKSSHEKNHNNIEDPSTIFNYGFDDARIVILETIDDIDLTEEQRLVVDYVAFYNFSYKNVGEIMGFSRRKVGFIYTYAVKKILVELKRRGIKDLEDLL